MTMADLTIDTWMVAWIPVHSTPILGATSGKPPKGAVKVGPWPDETGWSDGYDMTTGCCNFVRHDRDLWEKVALMFIAFHTLVVGDGIDPKAAHREFLQIDEFRRRISPDIKGAEYDA